MAERKSKLNRKQLAVIDDFVGGEMAGLARMFFGPRMLMGVR